MKNSLNLLFFFAALFLPFACQIEDVLSSSLSIKSEISADYLLNGNLSVYLDKQQVFRYKGQPGVQIVQIGSSTLSEYEKCFILRIASGTIGAVSSAIIKLDGKEILNTSNFSNNGVEYKFEICDLTEQSALYVEIRGTPDSYIDIWMEGKLIEIKDIDGNIYHSVKIGTQVWMVENLKTTKYNDGTAIDGYCWYNNDISNMAVYGALYKWYVVNTGKLAPKGWHVPTADEFRALKTYLESDGNSSFPKLAEVGTIHWAYPQYIPSYLYGTNSSGFTALPGGVKSGGGVFDLIGLWGGWWSTTLNHIDGIEIADFFAVIITPQLGEYVGVTTWGAIHVFLCVALKIERKNS